MAFALMLAALSTPLSASICLVAPVPLEERARMSPTIVLGRVLRQEPFEVPSTGQISTVNRIEVEAWLKGDEIGREVAVVTLGGVLEDRATIVVPALELEPGREYLFFLDAERAEDENPSLRRSEPGLRQSLAYADGQGAIPFERGLFRDPLVLPAMSERELFDRVSTLTGRPARDAEGNVFLPRPAAEREPPAPLAVTGISPNPANAGTIVPGDFLTITGSGFGASAGTVSFANADDGGSTTVTPPVTTDYVSWSDTSITVKVPRRAGTGTVTVNGTMAAPTPLTIGYALWEINSTIDGYASSTRQRYYLRNVNTAGGHTFLYNSTSGFSTNAPAVAAFERALATWRCSTGVNFTRTRTSTTLGLANDGNNVVLFDGTLPSGVFGRATYALNAGWSASCTQANTVWFLKDLDLQFKTDPPWPGYPWQYGPALATSAQWDFESVALHELGHAHGLGHRIAPGELMNYSISNGQNRRSPAAAEIVGGVVKMAYSTAPSCLNPSGAGTPMVAVPAAGCGFVDDPLDTDDDDDGVLDGADCAPADASTWAAPAKAVTSFRPTKSGATVALAWSAPNSPGTTTPNYDVLRSASPSTFAAATCVVTSSAATSGSDGSAPADAFYIVRTENACGGLVAAGSGGATVPTRSCP